MSSEATRYKYVAKAYHPYEPQSWYEVEYMWRATGAAALRRYETTGEVKDRYLVAEADQRAKAAHLRALGETRRGLQVGRG